MAKGKNLKLLKGVFNAGKLQNPLNGVVQCGTHYSYQNQHGLAIFYIVSLANTRLKNRTAWQNASYAAKNNLRHIVPQAWQA